MTKRFDLPFEWTDRLCQRKLERLLRKILKQTWGKVTLIAYFTVAMYERPRKTCVLIGFCDIQNNQGLD